MRHFLLIFSLTIYLVVGQEDANPLPEVLTPPDELPVPEAPEIPEEEPIRDVFADFPIKPILPPPPTDAPLVDILKKEKGNTPLSELPTHIQIIGTPDPSYVGGKGALRFIGPITFKANNGFQAFADEAIYETTDKKVRLIGNVSLVCFRQTDC